MRMVGAAFRRMDRRDFVVGSCKLLAGAACSVLFSSCSDFEEELPCLGPAAPPRPVAGMTYLWASKIGCALDCDLRNGSNSNSGGEATDDAPRINAAMAAASATNPITLIIDGAALISGLFLPAGGYWNIAGLGCGTGFFVKTGTNNDGIHNGGPGATEPPSPGPNAPLRGNSVSLQNFTINGNQGNGHDGDSTTGSTQGAPVWHFAINLMNLNNIEVENVVVVNSPSFQITFSNVGNVNVSGCVLRSQGPNTDGLHFDGPANDITISNCDITSGDDSIALICPEGYGGNISRVTVTNCQFNSGSFLMRLHPIDDRNYVPKFTIDTVSVSNCSGTCAFAGFLVGHGGPAAPNAIDGLTVSNCSLSSPAILEIGANFGGVSLENVTLAPSYSSRVPGFAFARSSAYSIGCTYIGTLLTITNCTVQRKNGSSIPLFDIENGSSLANLVVNGYTASSTSASNTKIPMLINVGAGSIGQLAINSVDSAHIEGPVSPGGFLSIGSVTGTGVLATGWEFPDNVMADNVPYISATTGLPSIKIDGVVEPYTP